MNSMWKYCSIIQFLDRALLNITMISDPELNKFNFHAYVQFMGFASFI